MTLSEMEELQLVRKVYTVLHHLLTCNVGKDFDFAGSTARVAEVLEEEHEIFDRNRKPAHKPTLPHVGPTHKSTASEHRHIPSLAPDMSLWGAPAAPSAPPQQTPQQPRQAVPEHVQNEYAPQTSRPPPGKKFMSLEEVEAQILARSQQSSQPSQQQMHQVSAAQMQPMQMGSQIPVSQPLAQFHHQIPQHTPSPGSHLTQYPPPPQEHQNFPLHQLPPHLQHMIQQNQNMLPQHLQPAVQERMLQQHLQQQMRLSREPLQQQPAQSQVPQQPMAQNRAQPGVPPGATIQQIQAMLPEAERARLLEEESKRLKRNHKIAQLVCRSKGCISIGY